MTSTYLLIIDYISTSSPAESSLLQLASGLAELPLQIVICLLAVLYSLLLLQQVLYIRPVLFSLSHAHQL